MQISTKRVRLIAPLLALALGAAACGGGDDSASPSPQTTGGGNAGATGGTFSLSIADPENPLLPANTAESEGSQVMDALFTGLVTYNVETSEVEYNGVAESIESQDQTTWTVKLKPGWTFHDGTPVNADSFINAWNFAANPKNAQGNSYFFANIDGYDDLNPEDKSEPKTDKMDGLKKVDDTTFTVTLSSPFAQYPVTVGYTAFYPLPASFFTDEAAQTAFGKKPIGNGPFKADAEYQQGKGITLSRYDDYAGTEKAKADKVEIRVYADNATAYTDVRGGNLDIIDTIPPDAITTAPGEFGDRFITRESSTFQYLGFPTYDPRYQDKRVRQAFSMAIDRAGITQAIFNGTRAPAFSAISPVVDGSRPDACKYCKYDPAAAKALLAQTGFDTSKPIELWFNAGAGHDEWVQAAGNNLRQNLGIEYTLRGDLQFAEYLPLLDDKGVTGPFRLAWAMDYPSPQNYLEPLYSTKALPPAGSNATFYSNPAFDKLITEGNSAKTNEAAIDAYQKAEDILLEDMPIMPMFFGKVQGAHSEKVSNVAIDAFGRVRLANVTVKQ